MHAPEVSTLITNMLKPFMFRQFKPVHLYLFRGAQNRGVGTAQIARLLLGL